MPYANRNECCLLAVLVSSIKSTSPSYLKCLCWHEEVLSNPFCLLLSIPWFSFCTLGQGIYLSLLQDWECWLVWRELFSGHFQVRLNSRIHYKLCLLIALSLSHHRGEKLWRTKLCTWFLYGFLFSDSQPQSDNMVANLLQNNFALYAVAVFSRTLLANQPKCRFFLIFILK